MLPVARPSRLAGLASVALVAAACNDIEIHQIPNEPPEVKIENQRDGDTVLEGYTVHLLGSATDDRGVKSCTWYVDDVELCTGVPDDDHDCACDWKVPAGDAARLRFEAADGEGLKDSQLLDLVVKLTEPPEVTITRPTPTGHYYSNTPVILTGTTSDAEDAPADLRASWADEDGPLTDADATPDSRGLFESTHVFDEGHHTLTVTVTDQSGKTGTDSVAIDVGGPNTPPTCELTYPTDGAEVAQFRDTTFAGLVNDPDVGADQLAVTFEDDLDGPMGTAVPTVDGDVQLPFALSTLGDHTVTMTVTDDAGASCTDTVQVTVVEPPSAPVVHVEPADPGGADDLVCIIDAVSVDPQGDPLTYLFRWTYDGVEFTDTATRTYRPGDTVSHAFTAPGQVWECAASATDGKTEGSPGTDSVTIATPLVAEIFPGTNHTCQLDTADQLNCFGDASLNRNDLSDGEYVSVGLGFAHTCGVDPYGVVHCAGLDDNGQVSGAPVTPGWVQIDAGDAHTCALDTAGHVTCWGETADGVSDTSGLTGTYTQVSSAFRHNCAVRTDHGVDCWGNSNFGRTTPTPGVQWSQISAGKYHTCGLDLGGIAHCFGQNTSGECNARAGTFSHVSAGAHVSCGVHGDGTLECWGQDTAPGGVNAPPPGLYSWVEVGDGHQCAVTTAGEAVCWGNDDFGECDPPTVWW